MKNFESYPNNKSMNWIAYRETAEFKKGLNFLETTDLFVPQSKFIILATALNIKKASAIDLYDVDQVEIIEVENMLSNLGLYFSRDLAGEEVVAEFLNSTNPANDDEVNCFLYHIASTPEALLEASKHAVPFPPNDELYGLSMDFPASAVKAYVNMRNNNESLLDSNDNRLSDEEKAFIFFRMSKDDWESEIAWLEQVIAAVKEYSPAIYDEVMEEYWENKSTQHHRETSI